MKIKELIERLQKLDPETLVFGLDREGDLELKEYETWEPEEQTFYRTVTPCVTYYFSRVTDPNREPVKGIIL